MKRTKRIMFSAFVITTLLLLMTQPVWAEEAFQPTTTVTMYRIKYDDGSYGDVNITNPPSVFDNWKNYTNYGNWYNDTRIKDGVRIGACFDSLVTVNASSSVTSTYDCYNVVFNTSFGWWWNETETGPRYVTVSNVIPVLKFYMEISSGDIMNGAQEIWYRSPLEWDEDIYNGTVRITGETTSYHHYLNIYNSDSTLVYAQMADNISDNRSYFKLNMKFYSGEKYVFKEFVKTDSLDPINSVDVYMAEYQDIGSDDLMDSYFFPGTPQALKVDDIELSWSEVFIIGIGRAGTEKVLSYNWLNDTSGAVSDGHWTYEILSQKTGNFTIDNVSHINLTIPFRTTHKTMIRLYVFVESGGTSTQNGPYILENITGVISVRVPITDPCVTETNQYWIDMQMINVTESEQWWSYLMIPSEDTYHVVNAYDSVEDPLFWPEPSGYARAYLEINHFSMYFEIGESEAVEAYEDNSIRWDTVLVGAGVFILGMFLVAVGAVTGLVPLIIVGMGTMVAGGYIIQAGFDGKAPMEAIEGLMSGAIQAFKNIRNFMDGLGDALWDLWIQVVEYATAAWPIIEGILTAIYEFIWFFVFLAIVWLWARFLLIMKRIAQGDIEGAVTATRKTVKTVVGYARPKIKAVGKVSKYRRRR